MSKFKLSGGYTYDPDFLPADDEQSANDADTQSADDTGTNTPVSIPSSQGGDTRQGFEGRIMINNAMPVSDLVTEINNTIDGDTEEDKAIKRAILAIAISEQGGRTGVSRTIMNFNNNIWGITGQPSAWGTTGTTYGNGTWKSTRDGKTTTYVNFDTLADGISFMDEILTKKGFETVKTPTEFSRLYSDKWVAAGKTFNRDSVYNEAVALFP